VVGLNSWLRSLLWDKVSLMHHVSLGLVPAKALQGWILSASFSLYSKVASTLFLSVCTYYSIGKIQFPSPETEIVREREKKSWFLFCILQRFKARQSLLSGRGDPHKIDQRGYSWDRILGLNPDKSLKSFLAIHRHLYSFALGFIFLETDATSYVFLRTHATSYIFLKFSCCT
jgi:hypothetical protein